MDHPEGASLQRADRVDFDRRVRVECIRRPGPIELFQQRVLTCPWLGASELVKESRASSFRLERRLRRPMA